MIQDKLSQFKADFSAHTELRAQINTTRRIGLLGGNMVTNLRSEQGGVSARVYEGGVYGFSSSADYTEDSIRAVLKAAQENAHFLNSRVCKGKGSSAHYRKRKQKVGSGIS